MGIIVPLHLMHPRARQTNGIGAKRTPTDDDVVERLVGDLVDCSEHGVCKDGMKANRQQVAIYISEEWVAMETR
jgi:hypothetical protein